ncbi:MAG: hypothetical protein KDD67_09230 [Ignavibacteriae bacterium]|nr:hypothetical protein [Ignavibacteriota bacterium]MCB9216475.1 hypothetical protein [Ignavibacteria bacterium]
MLTENSLYEQLFNEVFTSSNTDRDQVGVEVEFFPILVSHINTGAAQPGKNSGSGFIGLYPWLMLLADRHDWQPAPVESSAAIAFTLREGGRVTLEPGGQIEYSTIPHPNLTEALNDVERFEQLLREEGERVGLTFLSEGFNSHLGGEIPQLVVQKPRYLLMDQHFAEVGPYGRMMMRQTCATQINLDFGSPDVAVERWRLANLAAPALNALFANSPNVFHDQNYQSFRYEIWRKTDPCRTNFSYEASWSGDPVATYMSFALDATVLAISDPVEGFRSPSRSLTFRQWIVEGGDSGPDLDDWRTHLTTLFPDVRPRGFIEIRSIDALSGPLRRAAVELTVALLYNDQVRRRGLKLFEDRVLRAKGEPVSSWEERFSVGKKLLEIACAEENLESLIWYDKHYLKQDQISARKLLEDAELQNLK